jgi:hypothetical protein
MAAMSFALPEGLLSTHTNNRTNTRTNVAVSYQYVRDVVDSAAHLEGFYPNPHGDPPGYLHLTLPVAGSQCMQHFFLPAYAADDPLISGGTAVEIRSCPREEWRTKSRAPAGGRRTS